MDTVENDRAVNCEKTENDSRGGCKEEDILSEKKVSSLEIEVAPSVDSTHSVEDTFKKPLALESKGKTIKLPKNVKEHHEAKKGDDVGKKSSDSNSMPVAYTEPAWSSTIGESYSLEIIKSGIIIDTVDISRKPYLVFGRQSNCDIQLAHPTVSRHHAVLQHCGNVSIDDCQNKISQDPGIYIYDLGSTHGTFINKLLIPKQKYIRLHVGHILKFGGSTRSYVLLGPESDSEKESEKSVTELKKEAESRKIARSTADVLPEEMENEEDKGIDWGFGEDADEESDLTENPFAVTQNEDLYIADPKKSLRGWFEREGEDLEYNVEEKSFGQFLCQVKLPLDDSHGRPILAEALVKGKKKEAVVQCALEACRILDRMGLLRQANHESKKRKARNWEDDDFYDSDEDTFLDRTGTVERKREKRMRSAGKVEHKAETYDTLLVKHKEVLEKIKSVKEAISLAKGESKKQKEKNSSEDEEDALDAFMSTLNKKVPLDKVNIRKQKAHLAELEEEEVHLQKLIDIARPATLPVELHLKAPSEEEPSRASPELPTEKEIEKTSETKLDDKVPEVESKEREVESPRESVVEVRPSKHREEVQDEVPEETHAEVEGSRLKARVPAKASNPVNKSVRDIEKKEAVEGDVPLWVPPVNQTGDGKTKLNEKYGY